MPQTSSDHARIVLSSIIPNRRDLLDSALLHLTPSHFQDQVYRNIFVMLERYAAATSAVLTRSAIEDILSQGNTDAGKVALYLETYDALSAYNAQDDEFKWSSLQLRELVAEQATVVALTEAMEINNKGLQDDRGAELQGHADARLHVMQRFAEIDRDLSMQDSPEGDVGRERTEMLADYADRKAARVSGRAEGVLFGIPSLDFKIGGLQPGELDLIVGYSSDGKTSLTCGQLAWAAATMQGKNVIVFTTETLRPQVRRKLISRHSRMPHFGLPEGLNSRDLKNGTLSEAMEPKLAEIIDDMTRNASYGKRYIAQVPRGATIETLEARAQRISRDFEPHLIIVDYLALLKSSTRRNSDREEQGAILKEAKRWATTFNDGKGIPIVSPWQVNRSARENAERVGYYTTQALAETAEATNSADVIVAMLAPLDNESRYCEVKMQLMKNRDGETANSIIVDVDYATSSFSEKNMGAGMEELLEDASPSADSFAGLLA